MKPNCYLRIAYCASMRITMKTVCSHTVYILIMRAWGSRPSTGAVCFKALLCWMPTPLILLMGLGWGAAAGNASSTVWIISWQYMDCLDQINRWTIWKCDMCKRISGRAFLNGLNKTFTVLRTWKETRGIPKSSHFKVVCGNITRTSCPVHLGLQTLGEYLRSVMCVTTQPNMNDVRNDREMMKL